MPFDSASGTPLPESASFGRGTTPPGPGAREAVAVDVIELLVSWGAAHDPETGFVFSLATPRTGLSAIVRVLHRAGLPLLPDDLRRELDAITPLLRDATEAPPSLRARMQRVVDSASPFVDKALAERQAALRDAILLRGTGAGADQIRDALRALWSSERCPGLQDRLRALSDLDTAVLQINDMSGSSQSSSRPGPAPDSEGTAVLAGIRERLARIAPLLDEITGPDPGDAGDLRQEAVREYRRLVDLQFSTASLGGEIDSLLSIWERVIAPGLAEAPPAPVGPAFASLASRLDDMARQLKETTGNPAALRASEAASNLRSAPSIGDAAVFLAEAAGHLASARGSGSEARKEATSRLQAVTREADEFLRRQASLLPAERLVQARALLEQVPSIITAGTMEKIQALEKAIRHDASELQSLASTGEQRRTRHAERARSTLQRRVEEISSVATPRTARKLAQMQSAVARADGAHLRSLLDRFEPLERTVEQKLRLFAEREAGRARRWLQKNTGRAAGKERPGQRELATLVEDLSQALGGDDLGAIRDAALETRTLYRRLAPTSRPSLRVAATILFLTVVAGGLFGLNAVRNQGYHVRVSLEGQWQELWIVRNGRIVKRVEKGDSSDLTLAAGRYDIYVDKRFTGRVIDVPTEKVINQIPLPAPKRAQPPEGATSHGEEPSARP